MKEEIINKLEQLLIQQEFIDRENGKERYVKKTRIYKDLIKWFKENL